MLKIGHRGASGYAPENTLTSFRMAMTMGADGVELDVHRCKSGELVVIHDDTVDRTTSGTGQVAEMTLMQLRALSIEGGERIPTLGEVFEALGPNAYFFIEIKHANAAVLAATLIEHYTEERGWQSERLVLISFQHETLREAQRYLSSLVMGASFEQLTQTTVKQAEILGCRALLPNYRMLGEVHMRYASASGLEVIPWTVNDRVDIARTRLMGVHGIISDYPDRLSGDVKPFDSSV